MLPIKIAIASRMEQSSGIKQKHGGWVDSKERRETHVNDKTRDRTHRSHRLVCLELTDVEVLNEV
jgi:hypothetical protein